MDLLILALVLVDGRRAARTPIRATRHLPPVLHQGQPAEVGLTLETTAPHPVALHLREVLSPALVARPVDLRGTITAGDPARFQLPLIPRLRGTTALAAPALRVAGPWGLAWAQRDLTPDGPSSVPVHPMASLHGESGLLLRRALQRQLGSHATGRRGISTELHGLREYQQGDPLRSLHWKATARLRRPITREDAWEQHQHVVVMVDCGRPMAALAPGESLDAPPMSKLDHALRTVLALLRVVVAQGDSATLVLFSARVRRVVRVDRRTRSGSGAAGGFGAVFAQVHDVHADLDEPDYAAAAAWAARKVPRRSLALVVSSVVDLGIAEQLGAALAGLNRRHHPLLVNLEDPGLVEHARSVPVDVEAAFAKVSALSLQEANHTLAARLRGQGIDTLSASAAGLPLAVLQRYLDLKARRA